MIRATASGAQIWLCLAQLAKLTLRRPTFIGDIMRGRMGRRVSLTAAAVALAAFFWIPAARGTSLTQNGNVGDKPTTLSEARAAVEANLRTSEGKKYDEQMGTEFVQKHLGPLRQCKQNAEGDIRNFWILLRLDKDGSAKEVLLYPETKLGTCARGALLKETFSPPPRLSYWISVYMQLVH